MNVEEFVRETLTQISNGLNVDDDIGKDFFVDNNGVKFDLAVTTSSEKNRSSTASGNIGIKIAGVSGDVNGKDLYKNETVSRISFTVREFNRKKPVGIAW